MIFFDPKQFPLDEDETGFQLSAKPLNWNTPVRITPYANLQEALKGQDEELRNYYKYNSKSSVKKEPSNASTKTTGSKTANVQSSYKDPKLKTEAKKVKAATPTKTNDTATNFLDTYEKILHPVPKGTAPALDTLANMAYPEEVDLSNNDPYKPNRDIAEEFINKFKSQSLNTNRIDLGPAMALADAWMKGKSNLAGSYRPPETADSILMKMMKLQEDSQKNSDESEIRNRDSQTKAVKELFVKPRAEIARMLGNMSNLDTKTQASLATIAARLLNDTVNNEARNQTLLDMNINNNRTKAARDKSDAQLSAERIKQKWYASQSGQKKAEWIKQEREESKLLASKLLREDIINEKNWKSQERNWIQFTRDLADKVVREHDLVEEFGGDYHAARMQAYQMLRDNYDPETDSFPYLPVVDGRWSAFIKLNPRNQ